MSDRDALCSAILAPMYDAWEDFDRVLADLTAEDAVRADNGSTIAWTVGHCANQVDALINVRLAGHAPHRLVSQQHFRVGGDGRAEDWGAVLAATANVRASARACLEALSPTQMLERVTYEGSMVYVRPLGLSPAYAVARVAAHHYFHAGEIATIRSRLGQSVGDYPGQMRHSLGE